MDLCQIHREDVFGPSLDEFECQGHSHQRQIFSSLKMHCNVLAANNVTQQQTGPFRYCRG